MGYSFCNNTDSMIKLNDFRVRTIFTFANQYGCPPPKDVVNNNELSGSYRLDMSDQYVRKMVTALTACIDDIKTGEMDYDLMYHLENEQNIIDEKMTLPEARKTTIELFEAFIVFCKNSPLLAEIIVTTAKEGLTLIDYPLSFSLWRQNTTSQAVMSVNNLGWVIIQKLAKYFGWIPQGTWKQLPESDYCDFPPFYSNEWHEISSKDARSLAYALRKAVEHIMCGQGNQNINDRNLFLVFWAEELKKDRGVPDAVEFRKNAIALLESFIKLCERGPLWIG
jgi:hypothetical protein